jgi:hypothetical protein
MTTVTRSLAIVVHSTLQSTFDYISDLKRHPEWNEGLRIDEATPGPIAVGKEYFSRGKVAVQNDRANTIRVTHYAPPHTFGFLAKDPSFGDVLHEFNFKSQENGVRITRSMTLHISPIIAIFFRLLIYPMVGRPSMYKSFVALKAKLEKM